MSQEQKLLKWLRKKPITPMQALDRLGIYRLSARIKDLRDEGHNIVTRRVKVKTRDGYAMIARYELH